VRWTTSNAMRAVTALLLSLAATPLQARIDGVGVTTDGSIASPANGSTGFAGNSGAFETGEDAQTLTARLRFNANADVAAGAVREETGVFSFTLTFTVDEPAPYRLSVDSSVLAELTRGADSSGCSGSAAFSGVFADSNLPVASGSLGFGPLLVLDDGDTSAVREYRASGHGSIVGVPAGAPVTHVITYTSSAAVRSAGCEMAVRGGLDNGSTLDCAACGYPGLPARDASGDGVVVHLSVSPLCGDAQVTAAAGEECDVGAGNGTLATCCTADCRLRSGGDSCSADDNACTDELCDGSQAACAHVPNTEPCDDGIFCNGRDDCADGVCSAHAGSPCAGPDGDADCRESCDEAARTCEAADAPGSSCAADASPCTDDVCDAAGACAHMPRSGDCDDGDACTLHDVCAAGLCQAGAAACDACQSCDAAGSCSGAVCTPTPLAPTPTATPSPCAGDCSADGRVTVNEAVTLVALALGNGDVAACARGDGNADGRISVDELVAAVNALLTGC
ncbi:MAG: hypothetical protein ABI629_17585, partial [bacterium]